jgi:hypothetical protein
MLVTTAIVFAACCSTSIASAQEAGTMQPLAQIELREPCAKPTDVLPAGASGAEVQRLQSRVGQYRECVIQYARASDMAARSYALQAQAYQDHAKWATSEFKAYLASLAKQGLVNEPTDRRFTNLDLPPPPSIPRPPPQEFSR